MLYSPLRLQDSVDFTATCSRCTILQTAHLLPKPPSLAWPRIEDVESAGVDPDGVPRIRFKAGRSVGKAAQNSATTPLLGTPGYARQSFSLRRRCKSAAATGTSTSTRSRPSRPIRLRAKSGPFGCGFLLQVHAPSEHTLRKASWALEVQLWHAGVSPPKDTEVSA